MISTTTLIIITLIILVAVLGYATFNLLRKVENAEDIVVNYLIYLDKISKVIEMSDQRLKKVDAKGTFKSDDEVGFFFQEIKQILWENTTNWDQLLRDRAERSGALALSEQTKERTHQKAVSLEVSTS